MPQRISTRRAQIQERHARRQAMFAFAGTLVFGVIFLLVFVPFLFRLVIASTQNGRSILPAEDTLAPQQPAFQPPSAHQNTDKLELTGYTEAAAKVFLIVNESESATAVAGDDGAFTLSTTLPEGEYELYLYSEDEAGNTSPNSSRYPLQVDTTTPTLEIESPQDKAVYTLRREQTLEIQGKMSEKGIVFVNGSRVMTDAEGVFTTRFQLGEGENTITFVAEDAAGNRSDDVVLTVDYKP